MQNQKTRQPTLNILRKVFPWILATCMAAMMLAFPLRALATGERARAFADGMMNAAVMVGGTTCLVVMVVCAIGALFLVATGK